VVYGITPNFNERFFCCYLCPKEGKDVTADNFFTSTTPQMNYHPSGLEPDSDPIKDIIQKIQDSS